MKRFLITLTPFMFSACSLLSLNNPLPIDDARLAEARQAIADAKAADAEYCAPALQAKAVGRLYWAAHEITEEEYHPDENASLIHDAIAYARQAKAEAAAHCMPLKPVHFAVDSAELDATARTILDHAVDTLRHKSFLHVVIAGHTDSVGSEPYNEKLSLKRAQRVRDYLVQHGIAAARLSTKAFGETRPVADNATADGRAKNRRVELSPTR
ncbi:MAG: OmpA family protein [Zetaproteobacteria bacterium]|nr:MAG: OmpA family protein [Zetaproteobacteria bacterium]